MIAILAPALFAIAGAFGYLTISKPETKMMALVTFACGMLWSVYVLSGHVAKLF